LGTAPYLVLGCVETPPILTEVSLRAGGARGEDLILDFTFLTLTLTDFTGLYQVYFLTSFCRLFTFAWDL